MSEGGHDLHTQFPQDGDILQMLKVENEHFRNLAERHHRFVRDINRIESGVQPASDQRLDELRKSRLGTLDEIAAMIAKRKEI